MLTTLFIPLSGRPKCWRLLSNFLKYQKIDKTQVKLVLLDTSNDDQFFKKIQNWIKNCDYPNIVLEKKVFTNQKQLADLERMYHFEEVNNVMCQIYNYTKKFIERDDLLFVIEDDVIPPTNIFNKLLASMKKDVLCVSGAYTLKKQKNLWVAWKDLDGMLLDQRGTGIEPVKATGFGCLLIKAKDYIQSEITWKQRTNKINWPWGYDMEFFSKQKKKILIDWDAFCEHLEEINLPNQILLL